MTTQLQFDPKRAVYTPQEAATVTINQIDRDIKDAKQGVELGINGIDGYWAPMTRGKQYAIIGQSSNGKSYLVDCIENFNAEQLIQSNKDIKDKNRPEIIVHISVEDLIEEQMTRSIARYADVNPSDIALGKIVDIKALRRAAAQAIEQPIYRIGESLAAPDVMRFLTVTNMLRCLDALVNGGIIEGFRPVIRLIVFDYLQAFPLDTEVEKVEMDKQRRLQVRNDYYRIREAGNRYGCPTLTAVQAKQTLAGHMPPLMIPGMYDGEESSAIGQRSDGILTIWMPKTTNQVGTRIEKGSISLPVTDNLMLIRVAKQRGNLPAGQIFPCYIDYKKHSIGVMDLKTINL